MEEAFESPQSAAEYVDRVEYEVEAVLRGEDREDWVEWLFTRWQSDWDELKDGLIGLQHRTRPLHDRIEAVDLTGKGPVVRAAMYLRTMCAQMVCARFL